MIIVCYLQTSYKFNPVVVLYEKLEYDGCEMDFV